MRIFISTTAGIISGIAGIVQGKKQQKESKASLKRAKEARPENEDSEQRLFFSGLERKRLGYMTGSASSNIKDSIAQALASSSNSAVTSGVGGGSDILSIIKTQQGVAKGLNEALAVQEREGTNLAVLSESILDKMAQRKLDLGMYDMLVEQSEGQRLAQAGALNINAGIADLSKAASTATSVLTGGALGALGTNLTSKITEKLGK